MNLPTEEQCLNYFEEYHVPWNIKEHCLKVRDVAVFLANKLKEVGIGINIDLVDRSALLHDLFKMAAINNIEPDDFFKNDFKEDELKTRKKLREKYPGMYENQIAYEVFKDDFPELATTIRNSGDHKQINKSWEELVIHYADYRVFQGEVVSLVDRLAYLKERYHKENQVWDVYESFMKEQEKKIFSMLNFTSLQLKEQLQQNGR